MKNPQTSPTTNGIVIAVLVALLSFACVSIWWEAQVIANQKAVIQILMEEKR